MANDSSRLRRLALTSVYVALFLVLLGFIPTVVHVPPVNALVFVSDAQSEFISPPFLRENPDLAVIFGRKTTYGAARAMHYRSEHRCNEAQCWSQGP